MTANIIPILPTMTPVLSVIQKGSDKRPAIHLFDVVPAKPKPHIEINGDSRYFRFHFFVHSKIHSGERLHCSSPGGL